MPMYCEEDAWKEYQDHLIAVRETKKETNVKITHKFYVGAPHLIGDTRGYCKKTLAEAIKEASDKATETEQDQIVVQIVRVVRVQKRPIIVEKV